MRLLITGRQGQLARSLLERASAFPSLQISAVRRPELDMEQPGSATRMVYSARPDVIVNAAAYTAVDLAEKEPGRAFRVNSAAAGEIAAAARDIGARMIQISTDYVFGGSGHRPWRRDDPIGPLNAYGASKAAGEEQVRVANPQHLILRTSWVFSPFGRNFVATMLRIASERDEVRVVADQRGCPTNALDLADAILTVAEQWRAGSNQGVGQTMHVTGAGECSWAEFAGEVFETSAAIGGPAAKVVPIATADFPTTAARPRYSVLDCARFEESFRFPMRSWRGGLPSTVQRLLAER